MPPASTQQQTQQHTQQQAANALQQHAAALGLPAINWFTLVPIFIHLAQEIAQALSQGGGVQPQASPPSQP